MVARYLGVDTEALPLQVPPKTMKPRVTMLFYLNFGHIQLATVIGNAHWS